MGCDGWGSRLTIYIANSPIIIDHYRSPTLREVIDFSITSHFQMASTVFIMPSVGSNSFRFTNFVSYAVNNDVLFAYDVTYDVILLYMYSV